VERWNEAAAVPCSRSSINPLNDDATVLAALLAKIHDVPRMISFVAECSRRSQAKNEYVADKVGEGLLLLPSSEVDLQLVSRMSDIALKPALETSSPSILSVCKALSEYRLGRLPRPSSGRKKTLKSPGSMRTDSVRGAGDGLLRLGEKEASRAMLAKGEILAPPRCPNVKRESQATDGSPGFCPSFLGRGGGTYWMDKN